MKEISS